MSFDNWRKRLEIAAQHNTVSGRRNAMAPLNINFSQPQPEDEGYYRKPITEKDPSGNGRNIVKGWVPVAYFKSDVGLWGLIGAGDDMRDMTDAEVKDEELWSYVVSHPIPYELYKAVAELGEPWPAPASVTHSVAGLVSKDDTPARLSENNAPENAAPVTLAEHKLAIETAVAKAPTKIGSKEEAEAALGVKNLIAEKRLAADKAGRALYEPKYREYQALQKAWVAPVKVAETGEKGIDTLYRRWLESERVRVARENAEAARLAEEEIERNARAADRAIAAGEPEPPPTVTEPVYVPVTPEPVKPSYGGGRVAKAELKTFVEIKDEGKVAAYFRGNAELVAVLQTLAERATKLGQEVPGTTTRQGYA